MQSYLSGNRTNRYNGSSVVSPVADPVFLMGGGWRGGGGGGVCVSKIKRAP